MHHADAEVHQLIHIARHEGWVLTPMENSLPEHVVNNVQVSLHAPALLVLYLQHFLRWVVALVRQDEKLMRPWPGPLREKL